MKSRVAPLSVARIAPSSSDTESHDLFSNCSISNRSIGHVYENCMRVLQCRRRLHEQRSRSITRQLALTLGSRPRRPRPDTVTPLRARQRLHLTAPGHLWSARAALAERAVGTTACDLRRRTRGTSARHKPSRVSPAQLPRPGSPSACHHPRGLRKCDSHRQDMIPDVETRLNGLGVACMPKGTSEIAF